MSDTLSNDHIEQEVLRRYKEGAEAVQPTLCCPTSYDDQYLKILPQEIIDKDYGCGDPSKYVQSGDVALDLGSGGGKICYILSQKVGAEGQVIGVDFNDVMLDLARKYQDEMAEKIGHANVEFRKGRIQDLGLNLDKVQARVESNPVNSVDEVMAFESYCERITREEPLVEDNSVDVIVSNCVLNLVKTDEKIPLFKEMFRVLKEGGRAVISDIVCDEDPTPEILADPELWSGCISGAFREDRFLEMFEEAGFHGVEILERQMDPWHVIDGVEFRSLTVRAWKTDAKKGKDCKQAVVYNGPFKAVADERGNTFQRGKRTAVGHRTYKVLTDGAGPFAAHFTGLEPLETVAPSDACCFKGQNSVRSAREMKGDTYSETKTDTGGGCCGGGSC
jgi:arsenite methyltransferase